MSEKDAYLTKRLQPMMELIHERGRVTAAEREEGLPGRPANSTVRTHLRVLEARGLVRHVVEDGKFVYFPTEDRPSAAKSLMQRALKTFFSGSVDLAFATLLEARDTQLSVEELDRIEAMIKEAREKSEESK
jgi:predicted transcriptional regulator